MDRIHVLRVAATASNIQTHRSLLASVTNFVMLRVIAALMLTMCVRLDLGRLDRLDCQATLQQQPMKPAPRQLQRMWMLIHAV
jgi:hypothetical protein